MTLPVAILAGGLGTRLRDVTGGDLPKVLVPVLGRPFVDHKLAGLAAVGIEQVVLLVGHQGAQIEAHVGDGGQFGLAVSYIADGPELLGTGGALVHALPALGAEFWVTYGDTLLEFDVAGAEARFRASGRTCLMTVLPALSGTEALAEPSNARVESGFVIEYSKAPRPAGAEHVDYGMLALRTDAFADRSFGEHFDLADVLSGLATVGEIVAFEVTERFHDVGTSDALAVTEAFLQTRRAPVGGADQRDQ